MAMGRFILFVGRGLIMLVMVSFFSDYLLVQIVGKVLGRRFVTYDCRPGTPVRGSVRKGEAAEGQLAQERTDEDENQRGDILRT